ncbi:hypothetical protein [Falsiroseomonas tokyonensis]|uniref:J domain-containing protein n=1 Tax=Falsiroseomonas tokyonensis TaxID=430521 RepID=A0ABV7BR33_9PROT|nr:hypothetical protein [Falsiroseomonas tokyonensis]MBU8537690.1 hypothetical protein [Falsiroseomonas tokyonensis]
MEILAGGVVLALLVLGLGMLVRRLLRRLAVLLRGLLTVPARPTGYQLRGLRLAHSRALVRSEQRRAEALAAEVMRLRVELRMAKQAPAEPRFQRAKREFARRFHPDRLPPRSPDRSIRIAIFREYWAVLRGIERSR